MTYREMWEIYIEPVLKAQAEIRKQASGEAMSEGPMIPNESAPNTIEHKLAEAQAAAIMFGADPLEVGKAVRKSYGQKVDMETMRAKLLARENGVKAS